MDKSISILPIVKCSICASDVPIQETSTHICYDHIKLTKPNIPLTLDTLTSTFTNKIASNEIPSTTTSSSSISSISTLSPSSSSTTTSSSSTFSFFLNKFNRKRSNSNNSTITTTNNINKNINSTLEDDWKTIKNKKETNSLCHPKRTNSKMIPMGEGIYKSSSVDSSLTHLFQKFQRKTNYMHEDIQESINEVDKYINELNGNKDQFIHDLKEKEEKEKKEKEFNSIESISSNKNDPLSPISRQRHYHFHARKKSSDNPFRTFTIYQPAPSNDYQSDTKSMYCSSTSLSSPPPPLPYNNKKKTTSIIKEEKEEDEKEDEEKDDHHSSSIINKSIYSYQHSIQASSLFLNKLKESQDDFFNYDFPSPPPIPMTTKSTPVRTSSRKLTYSIATAVTTTSSIDSFSYGGKHRLNKSSSQSTLHLGNHKLHCYGCKRSIHDLSSSLQLDEKHSYHKDCLKCHLCRIKLNNENYNVYQGKVYCKQDFQEYIQLKPNCTTCKKRIEPHQRPTKAFDQYYHSEHLTCTHCSKPIDELTTGIVKHKKKLYCRTDFNQLFLHKCQGCKKFIERETVTSSDGKLKGKWHKHCFHCYQCQQPFPNNQFYVFNNQPYCQQHYHQLNHSLCQSCHLPIEGKCAHISLNQNTHFKYHPNCFICYICQAQVKDIYFTDKFNHIYCSQHGKQKEIIISDIPIL